MLTVLIVVAALVVILAAGLLLARRSFMTGGKFAQAASRRLLRSNRLGSMLSEPAQAGSDGELGPQITPDVVQRVLETRPELVQKMASEHGVDAAQVSKALRGFSQMAPEAQKRLAEDRQKTVASKKSLDEAKAKYARAQELLDQAWKQP